jgi:phenylpropionate dioxygenase-like ring-hydroxylating dioxygenase large terminal subunit
MLTCEDNALLTRVGPGTPLGQLMRHYWIPVVQSLELAPGGHCKRVKLLGEELVVVQSPAGHVGLLGECCPHRRASLYFGRNEEAGLRCVYHGWQFALNGQCTDMPNEPPASTFQEKVCQVAYPCTECGGVVWTRSGPWAARGARAARRPPETRCAEGVAASHGSGAARGRGIQRRELPVQSALCQRQTPGTGGFHHPHRVAIGLRDMRRADGEPGLQGADEQ